MIKSRASINFNIEVRSRGSDCNGILFLASLARKRYSGKRGDCCGSMEQQAAAIIVESQKWKVESGKVENWRFLIS